MGEGKPGGKTYAQDQGLGLPELIAIGVGGMIGGGIFSILGLAVDVSGMAAPLAFAMGGVIAMVAGYSYVRLALAFRSDGASYVYLRKAFPNRVWVAGIAGWTVILGYVGTLALYAFTFGAYSAHLFGVDGSWWARALLSGFSLILFLGINLVGVKAMGRVEDVAVYVKLALLAVLATVGLFTADPARLTPTLGNGTSSILLGGALIFVAFEGFQLITNGVTQTREPERNIPRGIYGSIAIVTVLYVLIAMVAVGNLDAAAIHAAEEYALAAVAEPVMGTLGVVMVDIAAILATSSAINATIFGSSRMAYDISQDDLAPRVFGRRSRSGIPKSAAITIVSLALLLTSFGGLALIASFSSMTFLLVSMGVCIANLKLRDQTHTATTTVVLGIGLIAVTIVLLVIYLAMNTPGVLFFCALTYAAIAIMFFVYRRLALRKRVQ